MQIIKMSRRHEISRRAFICSLKLDFRRAIESYYCSHSSFIKRPALVARIVCKQSLTSQLSLRSPGELILTRLQNLKDNVWISTILTLVLISKH